MSERVYTMFESPVGLVVVTAAGGRITSISLRDPDVPPRPGPDRVRDDDALARARAELEAYFAGTLRDFTLPLGPEGTPFQRRVWDALTRIPYGETTTYGEIAASLGIPSASRAVGAAIGRNPIAIVIPCHRVIGRNGSLTGYAAGIERKRWLLAHESEVAGATSLTLFEGDAAMGPVPAAASS